MTPPGDQPPDDDRGVRIRPAQAGDRDAIYDVCLRTGDAGEDATGIVSDRELFGDVWVGPYLALRPQLAFVAETGAGVGGYIVGADDTAAFAGECEAQWWPPRRARFPDPPDDGARSAAQVLRRHVHHPPPPPPPDVLAGHPAHLHVNLLPQLQGHGAGRRLLETLFDALGDVPGVHLGVDPRNGRAASFYLHHGFVPVGRARRPGEGWLLGRRLHR